MLLLLPILLLWARAPMAFSLPWRWTLLALLGCGMLQFPLTALCAAQETTPWLVRSTAAPQPLAGAAPPPAAEPATVQQPPARAADAADVQRQREGTPLRAARGRFLEIGPRWAFAASTEGRTYRVLENLALDRVVTAIRRDAGDDQWSVDGVITEFSGENYLLISRVRRATAESTANSSSGQTAGSSSTTSP